MDFINEVLDQEIIDRLKGEMDAVLEQYKSLVAFTTLHEGVLDNLPQDPKSNDPQEQTDYLIQKISAIQTRVDAVAKARAVIDKIEKSGGFSKEKVKYHRERITKNNKSLSAALRRVKIMMDKFTQSVEQEIEKSSGATKDSGENPEPGIDITGFGKLVPLVLKKAATDGLDIESMDEDRYGDAIYLLQKEKLIDNDGNITPKGQASWDSYNANKKPFKLSPPKRRRDAVDDLVDFGDDSGSGYDGDLDDLSFG